MHVSAIRDFVASVLFVPCYVYRHSRTLFGLVRYFYRRSRTMFGPVALTGRTRGLSRALARSGCLSGHIISTAVLELCSVWLT